jgi:DNA-directed RNA polymerase subunit RPC12/RpoP
MEHKLTRNGRSYTCLRCHQVLERQEDYSRISCAVEADCSDAAGQREADSLKR